MRITFDLDNMKKDVVRGKAILLKKAFPECRVRYRRSSSGNGGHIEILDVQVSEKEMYNIRNIIGDHNKRIAIDVSRHIEGNIRLPQQVLFDFKIVDGKIKRAGTWCYVDRKSI